MPSPSAACSSEEAAASSPEPASQPAPPPPLPPACDQAAAVRGLLGRLLPEQAHLFDLALCEGAAGPSTAQAGAHFTIEVVAGPPRAAPAAPRIVVRGTSGVELAAGVHWFLKHWAGCSVSWQLTGGAQVDAAAFAPEALARLQPRGRQAVARRAGPLSYYQNQVTHSYSSAFWEWERWEQVRGGARAPPRKPQLHPLTPRPPPPHTPRVPPPGAGA